MAALTIQLTGGPPWGFRLHGGRGQNIPLTVAKVSKCSKRRIPLIEGQRAWQPVSQPRNQQAVSRSRCANISLTEPEK